MEKIEHIQPSRCTSSLPKELKEYHFGECKIDGSRYTLHIGFDPFGRQTNNALLSRGRSKSDGLPVDKTLNIPHITGNVFEDLEGTVLDGEIFLKDFTYTAGVMNSSPAKAKQRQSEEGYLNYYVFDVMMFRGKDVRSLSLTKRRKILEAVVKRMGLEHVKVIPQYPHDKIDEMFSKIVKAGGEGLVVKDIRCGYGISWSKKKKSFDVSCFISGYKQGNGKYKDTVGAIELSVYNDHGDPIAVGFASGFDDSTRDDINDNREEYIGLVVDVFSHELSKDLRLRHPTWYRFRNDLEAEDCTLKKLKDDFKKSARSNRRK